MSRVAGGDGGTFRERRRTPTVLGTTSCRASAARTFANCASTTRISTGTACRRASASNTRIGSILATSDGVGGSAGSTSRSRYAATSSGCSSRHRRQDRRFRSRWHASAPHTRCRRPARGSTSNHRRQIRHGRRCSAIGASRRGVARPTWARHYGWPVLMSRTRPLLVSAEAPHPPQPSRPEWAGGGAPKPAWGVRFRCARASGCCASQ